LFAFAAQHHEFIDERNKLLKQQLRLESCQLIERMQSRKQIRPINPNIAIAMFFGSFARFIVQATEGHSTPTQKDLQALAETLWIAFKRDGAA
jgi:hypothetical protein